MEATMIDRGTDLKERKTPAKRIVDKRKRTVSRVHRTDDKDVVWHPKWSLVRLRISELSRPLFRPLIRLDQHHCLAKNPAEITAINLIDQQNLRAFILGSLITDRHERSIATLEPSLRRSIALNEIFAGRGLVTGLFSRPGHALRNRYSLSAMKVLPVPEVQ